MMSQEVVSNALDNSNSIDEKSISKRKKKVPVVILVIGMSGTGKTTTVQRLQHYAIEHGINSYVINLDPGVLTVPFDVNIDIRDTVDYKAVMNQYKLGPNGGIMTALNLFVTKFSKVIQILEEKEDLDWIIVDTPGQIEVFTWSASGQLISDSFASTFPTINLFVSDTSRCLDPQTLTSTMVYASSIMFKSQLPLVIAFNKNDIVDGSVITSWLQNLEELDDALRSKSGYFNTLAQSLALFTHEFYEQIPFISISSLVGNGMDSLKDIIDKLRINYEQDYLPLLLHREKVTEGFLKEKFDEQSKKFTSDIHNFTS